MSQKFLELKNISVTRNNKKLIDDINFTINRHEHWAITGSSGSGKTILAETIAGKYFHSGEIIFWANKENEFINISFVEQQHHFKNTSNTSDLYYQQRFNSYDSEQTITVKEEIRKYNLRMEWIHMLHLDHLLEKPLIQLSNGENKRLQLAEALSKEPDLLIFDNPFIGLDREGRKTLHSILSNFANHGIQLLIIISPHEITEPITHIARLENGKLTGIYKKEGFLSQVFYEKPGSGFDLNKIKKIASGIENKFEYAVRMINVNVVYGNAEILSKINWNVRKGEAWSVSGPNGAGKSTLLSLVNADNPKAYANVIYLFDNRRGTGESIWDIKKRTGYVSPELHLYFDFSATTFEVIASGLFDTIGLFRLLAYEQEELVNEWMNILKIENLKNKRLSELSLGQQRMILLARALIKNPPLLILDEPCQGLDDEQTQHFRKLIDSVHDTFGTTIIYVSHYTEELPKCINHFLRLENGRIKK